MNNQFKYRTRSTLGKSLSGSRNGETGQGNVRRSLFNAHSSPRGKTPNRAPHQLSIYENKKYMKPRSMLGRRKSLGFSLSHEAVTSQIDFVSRPLESTSLSIDADSKSTTSVKKSLFKGVSSLCVNKSLFIERTDLRKAVVQKKFLQNVQQNSYNCDNILPAKIHPSDHITQTSEKTLKRPEILLDKINEEPVNLVKDSVFESSTNSEAEFRSLEMSVMAETQAESIHPTFKVFSQIAEDKDDVDCLEANDQSSLPTPWDRESNINNKRSDELPMRHGQLLQLLLTKIEEYDELMETCKTKWKEIHEIRKLLKEEETKTVQVFTTPGILKKSCSKSVRKNVNGSVKFKREISKQIARPHLTPESTPKKTPKSKKSTCYTPKTVRKIVNSQMNELYNL